MVIITRADIKFSGIVKLNARYGNVNAKFIAIMLKKAEKIPKK
jgi:hypothetical protein